MRIHESILRGCVLKPDHDSGKLINKSTKDDKAVINIAIDGPSGAGKSTISRLAAERFGFIYVDTGALYRVVGLCALRRGIDPCDAVQAGELLKDIRVDMKYTDGRQRVYLNGEDVTDEIRTHAVSKAASDISAHPAVRDFLMDTQRSIAAANNVIMDGRDIGTTILPDAQIKIFLTASCEDRARRRYDELVSRGESITYERVLSDVKQRDYNDSHRAVSPLKAADDAIVLDTTGNTLEKSVKLIIDTIKDRIDYI